MSPPTASKLIASLAQPLTDFAWEVALDAAMRSAPWAAGAAAATALLAIALVALLRTFTPPLTGASRVVAILCSVTFVLASATAGATLALVEHSLYNLPDTIQQSRTSQSIISKLAGTTTDLVASGAAAGATSAADGPPSLKQRVAAKVSADFLDGKRGVPTATAVTAVDRLVGGSTAAKRESIDRWLDAQQLSAGTRDALRGVVHRIVADDEDAIDLAGEIRAAARREGKPEELTGPELTDHLARSLLPELVVTAVSSLVRPVELAVVATAATIASVALLLRLIVAFAFGKREEQS